MVEIWNRYKKVILPVAFLLCAILIFAVLKATRPQPPVRDVAEQSWPVAAKIVTIEDIRPFVQAYGEIYAGQEAELRARVAGTVLQVHPDLGDGMAVTEGDILVEIDPFDYLATLKERRADLNEAEAKKDELAVTLANEEKLLPGDQQQVNIAAREVERQNKLLKRKAVSRKSYDDALAALNTRKQTVLVRKQTIARLTSQVVQAQSSHEKAQSALEKAERDVADTQLKAPFSGFISDTDVAAGKQVSTADRLGRLISLARLEVGFYLSEEKFNRLSKQGSLIGREIEITLNGTGSAQTIPATIIRIDARIDAQTGGRRLFASLSNLSLATSLRPGLFVEVHVPDSLYENVISLPRESVHNDDHVYIITDGRLEKRSISVAADFGPNLLIRDGLSDGDQVCITRFAEMGSGLKVDVK